MDTAELLAKTTLFDDLSPEDVKALAESLKLQRFAAGESIVKQGEPGDSMFVVAEGVVSIYLPSGGPNAPEVLLRDLVAGHYFGELSLFDDKPRSAAARARSACELYELERDVLADHIKRRPRIAIALLAELSDRLRQTNALLSQRAAKDVNKELDEKATLGDRVADKVASVAGSWAFILSFISILASWMIFNGVALSRALFSRDPFDPFPFIFFNLILSIVAAFQGPVIMMSQNRQSLKDRAQAETDFKVNLKNEVGIETLIAGVSELRARLTALEQGAPSRPRSSPPRANNGERA